MTLVGCQKVLPCLMASWLLSLRLLSQKIYELLELLVASLSVKELLSVSLKLLNGFLGLLLEFGACCCQLSNFSFLFSELICKPGCVSSLLTFLRPSNPIIVSWIPSHLLWEVAHILTDWGPTIWKLRLTERISEIRWFLIILSVPLPVDILQGHTKYALKFLLRRRHILKSLAVRLVAVKFVLVKYLRNFTNYPDLGCIWGILKVHSLYARGNIRCCWKAWTIFIFCNRPTGVDLRKLLWLVNYRVLNQATIANIRSLSDI